MRKTIGVSVYNLKITGDVAATVTAYSGGTAAIGPKVLIILNDQGGGVMNCDFQEISGTLRDQTKGHPPTVVLEHEKRSDLRN